MYNNASRHLAVLLPGWGEFFVRMKVQPCGSRPIASSASLDLYHWNIFKSYSCQLFIQGYFRCVGDET
ncbi:MAG: hypothetical protein ACJAYC_000606 [Halieaceae bacterium]|jgi:hypothetical protein